MLERVLERERAVVLGGLGLIAGLSWLYLVRLASTMEPAAGMASPGMQAWTSTDVAAAQWALHSAALLSPTMVSTSAALGGGLLVAAGLFQWTPLKHACLTACRSPMNFLMRDWREGTRGALVMGLRHGAYCVGCCWAIMILLFVAGVMNLVWVAVLAAFVLIEKAAPAGVWVGRLAGVVLVGWGLWLLAGAGA